MLKVLFVCTYNSARSQMAEAFFNHYALASDAAQSAGIEPGALSLHAVKAMAEKGLDIFGNATRSVEELYRAGNSYSHIVVIGDKAVAEQCPDFPGVKAKIIWDLPDPSTFEGSQEELIALLDSVRDTIEEKVKALIERD